MFAEKKLFFYFSVLMFGTGQAGLAASIKLGHPDFLSLVSGQAAEMPDPTFPTMQPVFSVFLLDSPCLLNEHLSNPEHFQPRQVGRTAGCSVNSGGLIQ